MHDDEAFMSKIAESPGDDTAKLVYADWLDEQDHDPLAKSKAGLLRATVAYKNAFLTIRQEMKAIEPVAGGTEWMARSLGGFSVIVTGYADKIRCIKAIRIATGYGLGQAKWAAEHLPQRVWCTRNNIGPDDYAMALHLPEGYYSAHPHHRPMPDTPEIYRPLTWVEAQAFSDALKATQVTHTVEPFVVPYPPPALPPKPGEPGYEDPRTS